LALALLASCCQGATNDVRRHKQKQQEQQRQRVRVIQEKVSADGLLKCAVTMNGVHQANTEMFLLAHGAAEFTQCGFLWFASVKGPDVVTMPAHTSLTFYSVDGDFTIGTVAERAVKGDLGAPVDVTPFLKALGVGSLDQCTLAERSYIEKEVSKLQAHANMNQFRQVIAPGGKTWNYGLSVGADARSIDMKTIYTKHLAGDATFAGKDICIVDPGPSDLQTVVNNLAHMALTYAMIHAGFCRVHYIAGGSGFSPKPILPHPTMLQQQHHRHAKAKAKAKAKLQA